MQTLSEISKEMKISKTEIRNYLQKEYNSFVNDHDDLNPKYLQGLLAFAESHDERIRTKVKGHIAESNFGKDNFIRLYHQDVIEFLKNLPSNSIDVLVTDPAYSGMNKKLKLGKGRIVGEYKKKGFEEGKWFEEFDDTEENYLLFLEQARRVLKDSTGHIYIMFDSFSLLSLGAIVRKFFDVKNLITWDKVNIGMGHYFRRRHEYIMFATNGNTRKILNRSFPDVWRFKRIHSSSYPTQKPVEVFQSMIHASCQPGYTVCDPFLGSGSAAIAAIKNGCNFIGCDISDTALEISSNRINQYINSGKDILQPKSSAIKGEKQFWTDAKPNKN